VCGVLDAGAAPGELDERVLKAATGAEERKPGVEAMADCSQGHIHVPVRRARKQPYTALPAEIACLGTVGRNPSCRRLLGEERERCIDLPMRQVAGIPIAQGDDHEAQSVRW
jgi:hypothetical protein